VEAMECVCEVGAGVIILMKTREDSVICGCHGGNCMSPCSLAELHKRFCRKCSLHLHCSTLKKEAAGFFETLVTFPQTRRHHNVRINNVANSYLAAVSDPVTCSLWYSCCVVDSFVFVFACCLRL
jgi:hypothetical protein